MKSIISDEDFFKLREILNHARTSKLFQGRSPYEKLLDDIEICARNGNQGSVDYAKKLVKQLALLLGSLHSLQ